MESNLTTTFMTCKAVLPHMMERRCGVIVNLASKNVARRGRAGQASYGAAKAAVERLSESLADEVKDFGIAVNILGLGPEGPRRTGAGAGGGRLPRHRVPAGVPAGQEAAGSPRPGSHPPPPRRQPLPAQRAGQVRHPRQGPHRRRSQEREVHLLRLPVHPQAGQWNLRHPQAQRQELRGASSSTRYGRTSSPSPTSAT